MGHKPIGQVRPSCMHYTVHVSCSYIEIISLLLLICCLWGVLPLTVDQQSSRNDQHRCWVFLSLPVITNSTGYFQFCLIVWMTTFTCILLSLTPFYSKKVLWKGYCTCSWGSFCEAAIFKVNNEPSCLIFYAHLIQFELHRLDNWHKRINTWINIKHYYWINVPFNR